MTPPARCPHALRLEHCATCSTRHLLTELQTTVDMLAANLLPGTTRPWRAPQIGAEKRAELDRQAREDRLHIAQQGDLPAHLRGQGVVIPPGESPAPYDLDIADLLSTVLMDADMLSDRACLATMRPLDPPASSAFADPRRHLTLLAQLVEVLALVDPDLLEEIAGWAQQQIRDAAPALGLISDGQLLDALCPWCGGATGAHPTGGAKTLRVRTLPTGRPVVVCEGGRCEPEPADCGIAWRGLPAWDLENEGAWLADRIARTA